MKKIVKGVLRRLRVWASYATLIGVCCFGFIYFRIMNRTRVVGRKHIPNKSKHVLLVSNHLSMMDSFVIGVAAYFPSLFTRPSRPPYHLAARENYFRYPLLRLILGLLKVVPVDRGRFGKNLLKQVQKILAEANVHIFYQGTRSYDLDQAKNGVGFFIARNNPTPTVIPVYIRGTDRLFGGKPGKHTGLGRYLPKPPWFGRKSLVVFGPPIDFSDLLQNQNSNGPDLYKKITRRIVEVIKNLNNEHAAPA